MIVGPSSPADNQITRSMTPSTSTGRKCPKRSLAQAPENADREGPDLQPVNKPGGPKADPVFFPTVRGLIEFRGISAARCSRRGQPSKSFRVHNVRRVRGTACRAASLRRLKCLRIIKPIRATLRCPACFRLSRGPDRPQYRWDPSMAAHRERKGSVEHADSSD